MIASAEPSGEVHLVAAGRTAPAHGRWNLFGGQRRRANIAAGLGLSTNQFFRVRQSSIDDEADQRVEPNLEIADAEVARPRHALAKNRPRSMFHLPHAAMARKQAKTRPSQS